VNPVGFGIGISTCTKTSIKSPTFLQEEPEREPSICSQKKSLTSRLTAKAGQWRPTTSNHTDLDCKTTQKNAQIRHKRTEITPYLLPWVMVDVD
jgi:hypothetical protein